MHSLLTELDIVPQLQTATFSTSYNLVWTPEQVQTIARTARANIEYKCVDTFRRVIREAYERRKARRLAAERDTPAPSGTGPEHDIPIDRR